MSEPVCVNNDTLWSIIHSYVPVLLLLLQLLQKTSA
jgi:hypothetical protein